jgi:hypothetical protein
MKSYAQKLRSINTRTVLNYFSLKALLKSIFFGNKKTLNPGVESGVKIYI